MTAPHEATRPHPLLPFPIGALGVGSAQIVSGDVYLAGWSVRETTGAAVAQLDLFDGNGNGGVLVASIALAAGASDARSLGGHLLVIRNGLTVVVNSGAVTGALWFADRIGSDSRRRALRE